MSDIAEMGNTRKTERMLRAEETEGLQKPCNLLGLRKITSTRVLLISHEALGCFLFLTPLRQAVNRETVSSSSKILFSKVQTSE